MTICYIIILFILIGISNTLITYTLIKIKDLKNGGKRK